MAKRREAYIFIPDHKKQGKGFLVWLLLFLVIASATFIATNDIRNRQVRLEKQKVSILGLQRDLEGFTILHISDLHGQELGENQASIAKALENKSYNIVCMTGDMVGETGNYQPFLDLIKILKKDTPILFIAGDSDPAPVLSSAHGTPNALANYILDAQAAGAIYLDAPYPIKLGNTTLWFSPEFLYTVDADQLIASCQSQLTTLTQSNAAQTADGAAAVRAVEYRLDAAMRLLEARRQMKEDQVHIALSHVPLTYEYVRDLWEWQGGTGASLRSISLVLAGHYCGGQWRLPGTGAIYAPDLGFFPEDRLIEGLAKVSTVSQYISPGLGASDVYAFQPGRLYNTPAVTLITLTAKPQ